jgi:hypothetical protein
MDAEMRANALREHVTAAIDLWGESRPRHQQTLERIVGASDIGSCREYVRRLVVGEEFTDDPPTWAADVGSAVHLIVEEAMVGANGAGLSLSDDELVIFPDGGEGIRTTLPSGFEVLGHPDGLYPKYGIVPDWKTKDGLATIARTGPSQQEWWQVSLYALGLHQAGLIEMPLEEVVVALVYFDRSGKQPEPVVHAKPFDMLDVISADQWIEDVTYAVKHGEVAMRDKPASWCEACCPFVSDCRSDDTVEGGLITDPDLISMMEQYLAAQADAKLAKQLMDEAKSALLNVQGSNGEISVKWTHINPTEIPSSFRSGYDKINVKRVKK